MSGRNSQREGGRGPRFVPEILAAAGIMLLLGLGLWNYYFESPCRVEIDCRGMDIDVNRLRAWEKQERDSYNGILDLAGWRIEKQQTVASVSTGRRKMSSVAAVYGSASLVWPAKILSGDYALPYPAGPDDGPEAASFRARPSCILTRELSEELFGSSDTAGELVLCGGETLTVAGVIDRDGLYLLKAASEGPVEYAAFRMAKRWQAEAKARQRAEGG